MIKTLSKEAQAKLRSGIAIFSLQQCVEELVLNSIDAGGTCVAVKIDIEACKVQVVDNGSGMGREDMEKVGARYCTSKCSSVEDLDNIRFYGFRGEAIASITSLAPLVEISSRTKTSVKTLVKTFNDGKASDVHEAQDTRPSAGTTVLISNLFHNMPVRRKRMDSVLEVERLRQRVEAISLVHPSVSFSVRKDCSGTLLVQLPKTRDTYYRFVQIYGLARAQKLREVSYTYEQFQMTGHIGREGHYNNSLQFLFVNGRLLLKTRVHKLLNCLLKKLSSSGVQNNSPTTSTIVSSPKQRGGADLHGVYVINIKCPYLEYDVCLEPAKSLIEFRDWDSVLFCIEEGVKAFLTRENLVSEFSVSDVQTFASIFSDPTCSPCRNVKPQPSEACTKYPVNDLKDPGNKPARDMVTDVVQDQEVKTSEHVFSETDSTESRTNSQLEPVKEVLSHGVNKSLMSSSGSVLEIDRSKEHNNISEDFQSAQGLDVNDRELPLSVNNNTNDKITKIAITGHKEAQDVLKTFMQQSLRCAPKRKLSSLHESTEGSKITKVTPPRKLTLSFETGSLDKFKRMYGKGAETERQATNLQISDLLRSAVSRMSECSVLQNNEDKQVEPTGVDKTNTKPTCSSPASTRGGISLAGKLSHLKSDQVQRKNTCEHNLEDTRNDAAMPRLVGVVDTMEKFTDSQSHHNTFENSEASTKQCRVVETSGMNDLLVDDHPNEPTVTAPHRPDPSTPTSTASTGDTGISSKFMASPEPVLPSGQIINPASQHDLVPSKTGNEDQAPDERQGHEGNGPVLPSSDWLTHYDDSLGKLVYINHVTGLSKYEAPAVEETTVVCSTDVTNMAVSVVSEKDEPQGPGPLAALLSEWNNPVFVRPPQVAVDVTSGQAEGLAVKIHNILFPYRFTKDMIHSMKVIHQVDKKFLACLINTTAQKTNGTNESGGNLLVLVDQHAAHERVRLEGLLTESYEDDPDTAGKKRLCSSKVSPPLQISVTEEEMRLLRLHRHVLKDLALEIDFPQTDELHVLLERLPACFIEKENTELRRGRRTIIRSIAEEYLREHIEFLHSAGRVRSTLPLTVHNVLASQACHGAIKFNDVLSKEECCSLVGSLSSCQLPFQCAHGRPSIVPLADLLHLEDEQDLPKPNLRKLRRMYKAWQLYGKN